VDDEPLVCQVLEFILTSSGHKVEMLRDGVEALRMIKRAPFDLVISDFRMPKMSGEELAAAIKVRLPNLPIIIVTGNIELLNHESSDYDAVLEKPFSPENLLRLIKEIYHRFKPGSETGACDTI
jgi:Response regulator containing CheY-like receiver, AAA-type ATPase, and DNA-binding domains